MIGEWLPDSIKEHFHKTFPDYKKGQTISSFAKQKKEESLWNNVGIISEEGMEELCLI